MRKPKTVIANSMGTVTVLILSSTKCREVNKLEKPISGWNNFTTGKQLTTFKDKMAKWLIAESSLREWEIENGGMIYDSGDNVKQNIEYQPKYAIGSTHHAQILDNGKVKIIN